METKYEFAELICDREEAETPDGRVVAAFTVQFLVFPHRADQQKIPVQALPRVHLAPEQFPHLIEALQAAMDRYFPGTQTGASGPGSSGTTPQRSLQ